VPIPASAFDFDPVHMTCICPAAQKLSHPSVRTNDKSARVAYFEGLLPQARIMYANPHAAERRNGAG